MRFQDVFIELVRLPAVSSQRYDPTAQTVTPFPEVSGLDGRVYVISGAPGESYGIRITNRSKAPIGFSLKVDGKDVADRRHFLRPESWCVVPGFMRSPDQSSFYSFTFAARSPVLCPNSEPLPSGGLSSLSALSATTVPRVGCIDVSLFFLEDSQLSSGPADMALDEPSHDATVPPPAVTDVEQRLSPSMRSWSQPNVLTLPGPALMTSSAQSQSRRCAPVQYRISDAVLLSIGYDSVHNLRLRGLVPGPSAADTALHGPLPPLPIPVHAPSAPLASPLAQTRAVSASSLPSARSFMKPQASPPSVKTEPMTSQHMERQLPILSAAEFARSDQALPFRPTQAVPALPVDMDLFEAAQQLHEFALKKARFAQSHAGPHVKLQV